MSADGDLMQPNDRRHDVHAALHMHTPACNQQPVCVVLETRPAALTANDEAALDRLAAFLDNWLEVDDDT